MENCTIEEKFQQNECMMKMMNLRHVAQTLGRGNRVDDVAYFGDGFDGRQVRPHSRVANDNKLVVVAKDDAVDVWVGNHVWMKERTAEKTSAACRSVHFTILYTPAQTINWSYYFKYHKTQPLWINEVVVIA